MNELLNYFSDRNSLLYDENIWKNKELSKKIRDIISWVLNDSSSKTDREYLWEYWVFHAEKSGKISYWMFLEFIKFVKIEDRESYIDFIKQRAVFDLKNWKLNDISLSNLSLCLSNWILNREEFSKFLDCYFILNKNIIYKISTNFLKSDQISNEYTALISLLSWINWAIPKLKKYEENEFIELIVDNKKYFKNFKNFYVDKLYDELKNWDFDFYKEVILLYSVEKSD